MSEPFEVILTHEHTDFDALASLFGAALLHPQALPVLPRRLNRNVHAFLALYRNHFPFVTYQDLPGRRVTRAILVDARSVNWVRGMDKNTFLHIIDHHTDPAESLPPGATLHSEAVGANTTLLLESIIRQVSASSGAAAGKLTAVQATLLALGIHEDTGSLTYPSTTHRDARCLAWLLEPTRGVNLEVLGRFLNHPLTSAQRALYDTLVEQSEFHEVAGHAIVIAQADAPGFEDELSALVGRLRNHFEADAVFLVVRLNDVVQVVARSLTDDVNVGEVARALGGGGHARAAAAPIQDADGTRPVVRRILEHLGESARPAVRVAQIMSAGRPQTLRPDMTVEQAAELMSRYGHEGFPVVEQSEAGDRILGVLTRREADRALSHRMADQPVSRFMRAGSITISGQASIGDLRRLMTDSNWGQIPVVDDAGHIIGIVTRTDLIKLWDETALPQTYKPAISQKLQAALAPLDLALLRLIGREAEQLAYSVYIVGGFVRDLLLNHRDTPLAALDLDIVIEGDAIAFARRMSTAYGGRIVPHRRFNTAKWILDDPQAPPNLARLSQDLEVELSREALPTHLDFISARTEFYTAPTALPTVEESSIKLDLHRRDFTINTLAITLNPPRWGELLDFYGGLRDIEDGVIRVLHSLSFVDDPTRILRAVRYEQRFGFSIEPRTLQLLQEATELLGRITPARLRHEFERILGENAPERAILRLEQLGILQAIMPGFEPAPDFSKSCATLRTAYNNPGERPELRDAPITDHYWGLLTLGWNQARRERLFRRLGLSRATQLYIEGLASLHAARSALLEPDIPPSQAVELLDAVPAAAVALMARLETTTPALRLILAAYFDSWRHVSPALNGNDLRALSIPEGPIYRTILTSLRRQRLDGRLQTREQEIALARRMARQ